MGNELTLKVNNDNSVKLSKALDFWSKRLKEINKIVEEEPDRLITEKGIEEEPASWLLRRAVLVQHMVQRYVTALETETIIGIESRRIKNSFITIGCQLLKYNDCFDGTTHAIPVMTDDSGMRFGWISFSEWCERKFGIKKSTAYALKEIARRFSCDGKIMDRYKGYSYSQLAEMLPLSSSECEKLTPAMTVKQIRELKAKPVIIKAESVDVEAKPKREVEKGIEVTVPAEVNTGLKLKNEKERREWIDNHEKNFYLWVEVPALYMKVYRYDFKTGDSALVIRSGNENYTFKHYQMLKKNGCDTFNLYSVSTFYSAILEYLTKHRDEI